MGFVYKTDPKEKIFYVYIHKKADSGDVFYVGKGHSGRAKSKSGRNAHWVNVEKKHGFTYDFIGINLTEEEAFSLEIETIKKYRDDGVILCNMSNGGEGNSGVKHTEETKEKFRKAKLGICQSPEHADKSRKAKLGKKQPPSAVEYVASKKRKKVINSDGHVFDGANVAARYISESLGINASQGNISMAASGKRNEAYGKAWSYDISEVPVIKKGGNSKKVLHNASGLIFNSASDAARWIAKSRGSANTQTISSCARGEIMSAYGSKWSYL